MEELGVELLPRADDGVSIVENVEIGFSGVGINGRFDGVADVVDATGLCGSDGMGVGVRAGCCVAVGHPNESPLFGKYEVGVFVPGEKAGEGFEPVADLPVDHHAAITLEGSGEDDIGIGVGDGGDESHAEGADGETAGAIVVIVHVLGAGGVIELGLGGSDEDGFVLDLAVIDFGASEF